MCLGFSGQLKLRAHVGAVEGHFKGSLSMLGFDAGGGLSAGPGAGAAITLEGCKTW